MKLQTKLVAILTRFVTKCLTSGSALILDANRTRTTSSFHWEAQVSARWIWHFSIFPQVLSMYSVENGVRTLLRAITIGCDSSYRKKRATSIITATLFIRNRMIWLALSNTSGKTFLNALVDSSSKLRQVKLSIFIWKNKFNFYFQLSIFPCSLYACLLIPAVNIVDSNCSIPNYLSLPSQNSSKMALVLPPHILAFYKL